MLLCKAMKRRDFIHNLGLAGTGVFLLGNYGFITVSEPDSKVYKAIIVNFEVCSGCRTCESVCSAYNHKVLINDEWLNGTGNPWLSNIRVHHFNPDVDIPNMCSFCADAPCIKACPTEVDEAKGHQALYRSEGSMVIQNDPELCISCKSCVRACRDERRGVLFANPETGNPERMCTLCNGNPQCVKYCPFEALKYIETSDTYEFAGLSPKAIAEKLITKYYN